MKLALLTLQLFFLALIVSAQKQYQLQGTIGNYPIYMNLEDYSKDNPNNDRSLMGRYFYQSSLKDIVMWGSLQNNRYTLGVESGVNEVAETFVLKRVGENFEGTWTDTKGKTLPVRLRPIDTDNLNNPYDNIAYVAKMKSGSLYDYARLSFIKLIRESEEDKNGKSFVWFSEKHCDAPFFRLGNGFTKSQVTTINPMLDEIHFENIMNQLSCSPNWSYNEGAGIDYTTTIDYLDDNLIGFNVFSSWFCGGAHPDFGGVGYLLDLNNGTSYDLKDIYDLDPETIYKLVDAQEHFVQPNNEDNDCDYTQLEYWEYTRWQITEKGVLFTPYFYRAARACEEPFLVPFSELRPYKKSDFPYSF